MKYIYLFCMVQKHLCKDMFKFFIYKAKSCRRLKFLKLLYKLSMREPKANLQKNKTLRETARSVQTGLLHHPHELLLVDLAISISVCLVNHLLTNQGGKKKHIQISCRKVKHKQSLLCLFPSPVLKSCC